MLAAKLLTGGGTETLYAEDVFGVWLRSGTGAALTINLGIDMTSGGLLWTKSRSLNLSDHALISPTQLGSNQLLKSNTTGAKITDGCDYTFTSTGYSTNANSNITNNVDGRTYVDWVFRNADKFYNHTTVVKSGGSNATVSFANLTTLGMVRVKRTDAAGSWYIWHRSLTAGKLLIGETTAAEATLGHITVSGTTVTLVNGTIADGTYLVEGFAHDTGTDGLIQCGSFTTDGSGNATVSLGWEPQYVLIKNSSSAGDNWQMVDAMRGLPGGTASASAPYSPGVFANLSNAEQNLTIKVNATGFAAAGVGGASVSCIYLAIRRPNKPPTTGTQVYNAIARTGTGAAATVTGVGFAPDALITHNRNNGSSPTWTDRLRGSANALTSNATTAEQPSATTLYPTDEFTVMDGVKIATSGQVNGGTGTYINHFFKRAPGVFDVVCYTGTGVARTVSHGLGAVPELMIVKGRSIVSNWFSYYGDNTKRISLETASAATTDSTAWNNTTPTASVFSVGTANNTNYSGGTFVAYLFATLAGISKVGSYTGNGSSQTINCGFTTGARFVLIKRTDSTGDWYVWDTARGIVASTDPHLSLNTTAAEVTTDDSIDPDTTGFVVNQLAATNINVTSASYIYLAFA